MKTLELVLGREFPYTHQLHGMPTCYRESVLTGRKKHHIRRNNFETVDLKREIDKGNRDINLCVRECGLQGWDNYTFMTAHNCHYTDIKKVDNQWLVSEYLLPVKEETLAINEGLTLQDFKGLYPYEDYEYFTLFYFSEFNYLDQLDDLACIKVEKKIEDREIRKIYQASLLMGDVQVKRKQHFDR